MKITNRRAALLLAFSGGFFLWAGMSGPALVRLLP